MIRFDYFLMCDSCSNDKYTIRYNLAFYVYYVPSKSMPQSIAATRLGQTLVQICGKKCGFGQLSQNSLVKHGAFMCFLDSVY